MTDQPQIAVPNVPLGTNPFAFLGWEEMSPGGTRRARSYTKTVVSQALGIGTANVAAYGDDGEALAEAVETGLPVYIPPTMTEFEISSADALDIMAAIDRIEAYTETEIKFPAGQFSTSEEWIARVGSSSRNLRLMGADPIAMTLSSVVSVTGSSGAYSMVLAVNDATGVEVGDAIKNWNIGPLMHLSGDQVYLLRARPLPNELYTTGPVGVMTCTQGGGQASFLMTALGQITFTAANPAVFSRNGHGLTADMPVYLTTSGQLRAGTCTISNASPAVVTFNSHPFAVDDEIKFTTTGALPSPLVAGTSYYVISSGFGANSFQISATLGGAAINTTTAGSGTHSVTHILANKLMYVLASGLTTSAFQLSYTLGGTAIKTTNLTTQSGVHQITKAIGNYLNVGDLFHVPAYSTNITAVGTNFITTDGAWPQSLVSTRGWWMTPKASGTIGTGGVPSTTIIGTGTVFTDANPALREANAVDYIICLGMIIPIGMPPAESGDPVVDATTVRTPFAVTIPDGTPYSIWTAGAGVEGAFRITNVDAVLNRITVVSTSRTPPPVYKITTGEVLCLKTVFIQTGTGDGIIFDQDGSLNLMQDIAVISTGGYSDSMGLAMGGRNFDNLHPSQRGITANFAAEDCAFIGFGYNLLMGTGGKIEARHCSFSGALVFNAYLLDGSINILRSSTFVGAASLGIQQNAHALVVFTEARVIGNGGDGWRGQQGATLYGELPYAWGNVGMSWRFAGTAGGQINEGISMRAGQSSLRFEHGRAEVCRMILAGGTRNALEALDGSEVIATQIWISGCTNASGLGAAVYSDASHVQIDYSGLACCQSYGIIARNGGKVLGWNSTITKQAAAFYAADPTSEIIIPKTNFSSCASGTATLEGRVYIQGYTGTLPLSLTPATLDQEGTDGYSMISAGGDVEREPLYKKLTLNGAGLRLTGVSTPAQLTADANAMSLNFGNSIFRLNSNNNTNAINGIASGSVAAGAIFALLNPSANIIGIRNENASASAADRFLMGKDTKLRPNRGMLVYRDGTASRYVPIAGHFDVEHGFGAGTQFVNGALSAAVGSNALTISVKCLNGADPSAADPVFVIFRNPTSTTGTYVVMEITSATSIVVSSGSTLGTVNSQPFRLWVVGINDAGTFRLGVVNCLNETTLSIRNLRNDSFVDVTAEGGAGAADSSHTIYGPTTTSAKPCALLGYMDWSTGLATAGTWSAGPAKIQLWNAGVPMPGQVRQVIRDGTNTMATGTTTIPKDNTIPQNTEGDQYMSASIVASAEMNLIRVQHEGYYAISTAGHLMLAIFRDAGANALRANADHRGSANSTAAGRISTTVKTGSAGSTTFNLRAGLNTAGTVTFGGTAGAAEMGGVAACELVLEEIQG